MQLVTYTSDVESLYRVSQHWFASAARGFMYLHRRVLRKLICFLSNLHVYRTQFLMDLFKDPILSSVCVCRLNRRKTSYTLYIYLRGVTGVPGRSVTNEDTSRGPV